MAASKKNFYFLSWNLISSINNPLDLTQGNEVIEITIRDIDSCRRLGHYTIPVVQSGQPFTSLKINLLYQKDLVVETFKNICATIEIYRGIERRLIFTNCLILPGPCFMDRTVVPVPIYRIWHIDDYIRMILGNVLF
ncbi:unnamed protein product [Adineta ricciae]|uniref:Uncharacterized protein n=1 Tax=Adineta ricciae TaxID=249248 RepID=A0A815VSP9_ADIRI|nr:unnamed protein product [Adineta ricciae]CAF1539548.1 unnamed protein product [Adineta ricciae]